MSDQRDKLTAAQRAMLSGPLNQLASLLGGFHCTNLMVIINGKDQDGQEFAYQIAANEISPEDAEQILNDRPIDGEVEYD